MSTVNEFSLDDFISDPNPIKLPQNPGISPDDNKQDIDSSSLHFLSLIDNIPSIKLQLRQGSAQIDNFIVALRQWSSVEQSYSRGLQKVGEMFHILKNDATMTDGIGLFKSNVLDMGVQTSEYSKNLLDDVTTEITQTAAVTLEAQNKYLRSIDASINVYTKTFAQYEKSIRNLTKLTNNYKRQQQQQQLDQSSNGNTSPPTASDSTAATKKPRRRSRGKSWGRLSFSSNDSSGSGSSSGIGPSPTATAAKAFSFFDKMLNSSDSERREVRLETAAKHMKEGHVLSTSLRSDLNELRNVSRSSIIAMLTKLEAISTERSVCLVENMRKVCIYLSSRFANGQYDTQMLSNMLETINVEKDRSIFVKQNIKNKKKKKKEEKTTSETSETSETTETTETIETVDQDITDNDHEKDQMSSDDERNQDMAISEYCLYYNNELPPVPIVPDYTLTFNERRDRARTPDGPPPRLSETPPPPPMPPPTMPSPPKLSSSPAALTSMTSMTPFTPLEHRIVLSVQKKRDVSSLMNEFLETIQTFNKKGNGVDIYFHTYTSMTSSIDILNHSDAIPYDILLNMTKAVLENLVANKRMYQLDKILSNSSVVKRKKLQLNDGNDNDETELKERRLLDDLCRHPFLIDFNMWDRCLNASIKQSRMNIGYNSAMDHDIQEINVAMGQLIPFAQTMYTIGWPIDDIRGLLRSYTLTLPEKVKQWNVLLGFMNDLTTEENTSASNKIVRCIPLTIKNEKIFNLGGNVWERYPESLLSEWSLSTCLIVGSGALGIDLIDNNTLGTAKDSETITTTTMRTVQEYYKATVIDLRDGPALQSGMKKNGVVVAIEGRHTLHLSFIEVVHRLKEASLLRPFSVTLAYKDACEKEDKQDEEVINNFVSYYVTKEEENTKETEEEERAVKVEVKEVPKVEEIEEKAKVKEEVKEVEEIKEKAKVKEKVKDVEEIEEKAKVKEDVKEVEEIKEKAKVKEELTE